MAEDSGINKTQVWIAVITVVGSLLTAVIVNFDKLTFRDEKTNVAASPAVVTKTQPDPVTPIPSTSTVDIGGEWRSDDGSRFIFTQSGSEYEYTHTALNGTFQSIGKGKISGRDLSHTFETATGETGTCTAFLNAGATKINGNCVTQDGAWSFVIER
ncbi:MAG TPA: hypothetical protein VGO04_30540 [Ensifer sp.]|jgi:hypothetical protein|uniref:hypothetical protein n=1 Tax=Ensifer sp. TaxID=1872086 RepID=UPI002E148B3F|nr:hypothetical protein [Ensifer sp.]